MLSIIKVKDISPMALSEDSGLSLREKISNALNSNSDKIQIDFDNISIFTTMFFNASIGYFILNCGSEIMKKIELINLSSLGRETFEHSKENAEIIHRKKNAEAIDNITTRNIEEL